MLVSFATTGEKTVAAVMSPKNKTVSSCKSYICICMSMWFAAVQTTKAGLVQPSILHLLSLIQHSFESQRKLFIF